MTYCNRHVKYLSNLMKLILRKSIGLTTKVLALLFQQGLITLIIIFIIIIIIIIIITLILSGVGQKARLYTGCIVWYPTIHHYQLSPRQSSVLAQQKLCDPTLEKSHLHESQVTINCQNGQLKEYASRVWPGAGAGSSLLPRRQKIEKRFYVSQGIYICSLPEPGLRILLAGQ